MMDHEQFAAMLADRDAGTQGPWIYRPDQYDDWGVVKVDGCVICQARDPERLDSTTLAQHRKNGTDPWEANARRIARVPDMEAEIIRLRAALDKADARKVKALVWDGKDGYFRAHDLIGGFYEIIENDNEFYLSRLSITGGGKMAQYPTLEAAISAASGEHTARILSALQ